MSYGACAHATAIATREMTGAHSADFRALLERGAAPEAFLDLIASLCPADLAAELRAEFRELPLQVVSTIVTGWAMAMNAGVDFRVMSVRPESVTDFARRHLTRVAMNMDDGGVAVEISHIPSRHAAWQRQEAMAVAV